MFSCLGRFKIVPLLKIKEISIDDALKAAEALIAGGLPVMEITFRRHSDSKAIREIAREFPQFMVGAGNILNKDQLLRAMDCNAKFATAPGFSEETIETANKKNIMFAPGASTPTDIEKVLLSGCVDFQFFPAEQSGGAEYLKAVIEPFDHLPIEVFPKGGITLERIKSYLELPYVSALSMDSILKTDYIANKAWNKITEAAKEAVDRAGSIS